MRKLLPALLLLLAPAAYGQCAGVTSCSTVASPTAAQLLAALNSINLDNTTLTIPVGSSTITTLINYNQTKSFILQGAGAISATTGGASTTGTDRTIFINHVAGNDPILRISTIAGKSLRITGIAFIEDSGTVNPRFNGGSLHITGHSQSVRVDHSHFTIFVGGSKGLGFNQNVTGVTDHVFINTTQTITNNIVFENGGTWNGDSGDFGNGSWSDGDHWGTSQFMFVEDTRSDGGYISDCGRAGRYVFRYSTAVNTNALFEHGTHDEFRGCREGEAYNNSFSNPNAFTDGGIVHSHSGTNLVWGNIVTNFKNAIDLGYYRTTNNNPYGLTAVPNGFGACGPVPGLGPSVWDQNATPNGYACLDQPGRGSGDLLTNFSGAFTSVLNSTTGTRIWPNQALTPVYVWNNNLGGSGPTAVVSAGISIFTNNVDYYMQFGTLGNPGSFNGTIGVGSGLLSARPATCTAGPGGNTPGVAYWATDATNPQDANHNGVLYVCNPTNTWTTYYTPYTYPHPLTGGAAPALSLSPSPVAFGNQNVSTQSAPITVTVSNTGTASEILATPYFVISNPTEFLNTGGSCTNGGTIPAGSACTTTLAFKPSATGARTGTLTINGTVGATANLTGTGTSVAVPVVQLGPRTVNFGTVTTGTTSPTTMFTLQNTGTATLNITSIISSIPARFPISANTCGGTLAPSASCTFQAAFAPIAVGAQTATITVTTNASTNPDLINLSGTGFTPNPQPPAAPAITIMITRGAR